MSTQADQSIRQFIQTTLAQRGDHDLLSDEDSLFMSGRLDSLAMMNLVVFLENNLNVDFSVLSFDVSLIDSLNAISSLVKKTNRI